jgi:hypothetical protein
MGRALADSDASSGLISASEDDASDPLPERSHSFEEAAVRPDSSWHELTRALAFDSEFSMVASDRASALAARLGGSLCRCLLGSPAEAADSNPPICILAGLAMGEFA